MTAALCVIVLTPIYVLLEATRTGVWLSPVLGIATTALCHSLRPNDRRMPSWHLAATAVIALLAGLGIGVMLHLDVAPGDMIGVALAGAVAAGTDRWWRRRALTALCAICFSAAPGEDGAECPRCGDHICTASCWNARYGRCQRCHDGEVVILPHRDGWWAMRLGARVTAGSCVHCGREAAEVDLRGCGQCHVSLCRRCWDYLNGACARCAWVMPGLPDRLTSSIPHAPRTDARGSPCVAHWSTGGPEK